MRSERKGCYSPLSGINLKSLITQPKQNMDTTYETCTKEKEKQGTTNITLCKQQSRSVIMLDMGQLEGVAAQHYNNSVKARVK